MQASRRYILHILLIFLNLPWMASPAAGEEGSIELRERLTPGNCTHVRIELKAEGLFRPGLPPDALTAEAKMPKPLALNIQSRLLYAERLLQPEQAGGAGSAAKKPPAKAVRWVTQAA
ncbi:MAG: hypothetical protein ACP5XB_30745, partial [Isosphaeraceae bacterium]